MRVRPLPAVAVGLILVLCLALPSCRSQDPASAGTAQPAAALDAAARSYVTWTLALDEIGAGARDSSWTPADDGYYGPAAWLHDADVTPTSATRIAQEAERLADRLAASPAGEAGGLARRHVLWREVRALAARARAAVAGKPVGTFDVEARTLLGFSPPPFPEDAERDAREALAALLPGGGSLAARYAAFERRLVIPADRVPAVMTRALDACHQRTRAHVPLPPGEHTRVAYVTGEPWNADTRYEGHERSLIRIDTDHPLTVDRVLELACHEGYPGHHVFDLLLDDRLVQQKGWREFTVRPPLSPGTFVEEAIANFAPDVAFPGDERLAFERDVLFPLAGLNPKGAARAEAVRQAVDRLAPVTTGIARQYLDGTLDRSSAARALAERAAMPDPEGMLRFIDRYRSYVIAYTMGKDLVRRYVESRGGTADDPDRRWQVFATLLGRPVLPTELENSPASGVQRPASVPASPASGVRHPPN